MSQSETSFTVSDRRHFTPEGRPRGDSPDEPSAERAAGAPAASPLHPVPADFQAFLVSLAAQAGLLLSGEGMPEGADPAAGLEGAASIIGILEMLKDKTEGRRTGSEDALLEDLLFQLRMAYVEKSRSGGA